MTTLTLLLFTNLTNEAILDLAAVQMSTKPTAGVVKQLSRAA